VDIHFIHVRSRHPNALPLIMTHGWPGSVFELLKVIGPLTDPTAYGGRAEDAFDLVIPSIPGFGFSEKPKGTGWGPDRIARAWDVLMKRLGYTRYVSQGGDWGAVISDAMARQAPPGLLGIHVNRLDRSATIPPEVAKALNNREPAPANLTAEERVVFDQIKDFYKTGTGYSTIMGRRLGSASRIRRWAWQRGSTTSSPSGCSSVANRSDRSPATRCWTTSRSTG
jgi:pimeloyl-ACP methyl ester carboxylesterase